jgi:hypothetical protein
VFGCSLIVIYLGLFVDLYFKTYKQPISKVPHGIANGGHYANGKLNGITYVPLVLTFSM